MTNERKFLEKFLYEIWRNHKYEKEILTLEGESIEIQDPGSLNENLAGPDFIDARIKIGNITYVGDVEIDSQHSDWRSHGHNINVRFNKVILHVIASASTQARFVVNQEGRKIPTICFDDFVDDGIKNTIEKYLKTIDAEKPNLFPCKDLAASTDEQFRQKFVYELGVQRFKVKTNKIASRLKELIYLHENSIKEPIINYDVPKDYMEKPIDPLHLKDKILWEQLFYENLFEALGYSPNKNIFSKISKAVTFEFIRNSLDQHNLRTQLQAVFFNVGGIIPEADTYEEEATAEYIRKLKEDWMHLKSKYDGQTFDATDWHFFRLRPSNFPTIRLAGGVELIIRIIRENLLAGIVKRISEIYNFDILKKSIAGQFIVPAKGYWSTHYIFDRRAKEKIRYLIGSSRVDEILINVVLPYFYVYFDLFGKHNQRDKLLKFYSQMKVEIENGMVKEIASNLQMKDIWKRTIYYQGLIELFRGYCSRDGCSECKIGEKVFT